MTDPITLRVEGMSCQGCARSVASIISAELGLDKAQVQVSVDAKRATFPSPDPARPLEGLLERLKAQGFDSHLQAS